MSRVFLCYNIHMPNAPKTPTRTVRVPDDLWLAAQKKAAEHNITVTSVLIAALAFFVDSELDKTTDQALDL